MLHSIDVPGGILANYAYVDYTRADDLQCYFIPLLSTRSYENLFHVYC